MKLTQQIIAGNSPASGGKMMKPRLLKSILGAACAIAPLAAMSPVAVHAQSVIRPAQDVSLSIGNGQLINVPGRMADVFVANEAVADVQVKSPNQFYLFGKGGGSTTVYASNAAGDVIWSANVRVGSNLDSVDSMLRLAMPDAQIGVSTMGTNTFLLTGTVAAPEDAAEAERLVAAYAGKDANVISRLKTATPLQVNLQVRIAEVSRSLMRNINVNLQSIDGTGGFKFGIGQGRGAATTFAPGRAMAVGSSVQVPAINPLTGLPVVDGNGLPILVPGSAVSPADVGTTLAGAGRLFGLNLIGALDAGEQVGLVTTLSQPNLTALSGETAEFLAGGEFPIPLSQGLGATSVEYKKYGVSLSYSPTVLSNGRISLRVRPEVSELSSQGAVVLGNFEVPALTVRRAETTVELGSGQSFMIAGLMSNNSQQSLDKMPGAGDVPILGALFRSRSYRRGETELVIVVTPYLVNPVNANDIALPTDGFKAPNAIQQLLGNMDQDGVSGGSRPKPTVAPSSEGTAPAPSIGAAESKPAKSSKRDRRASTDVPSPGFSLN
jgi:pilus assembly protein CpaC